MQGALNLGMLTKQDVLIGLHRLRRFVNDWEQGKDHHGRVDSMVIKARVRFHDTHSDHVDSNAL
jgi:hypothetical protein